jgi:uncharacterized protein (TIGR02145 family)
MKKSNSKILFLIALLATAFLTSYGARKTDPLTTDIGVTINGITWATRNVDAPGTFAPTPESAGMFFQWNRRKGWNATDSEVEEWDSSISEGTMKYAKNDPCPEGWRVPTFEELETLVDIDGEWTTRNGINGRSFGVAPNQIFLSAAGLRDYNSGKLQIVGMYGLYWSSMRDDRLALFLNFLDFGSGMNDDNLTLGLSIRCVLIN